MGQCLRLKDAVVGGRKSASMTTRLIECVPEGRDRAKIDAIAAVVETVEGVRLLDVDLRIDPSHGDHVRGAARDHRRSRLPPDQEGR